MSTDDHARHHARLHTAREVAVALAAVIALHAALGLWLLRETPRIEPRAVPRTIVVRLLSAPPASAPQVKSAPPRVAASTPTRPPPHRREAPETRKQSTAPLQPDHGPKALARHEAMGMAAQPSPPLSRAPATAEPAAAPPTARPDAPAVQPQAMRAPRPVSHVDCRIAQPDYPEAARRRGEAGTAVVRFVIGVDGRVEDVQLVRSSGYARLDAAALDALQSSTCRPWQEAGVTVRVMFEQTFVFGLEN